MVKVLLIPSIACLLCAAGFGFSAQAKVKQKVRELEATRADLQKSESALALTTNHLGKTSQDLATAHQEIDQKSAALAKLDDEVKASKDAAATLEQSVKNKEQKLASVETELSEAKVKLAEAASDKSTIQALEIKLAEASRAVAEAELARSLTKDRLLAAEEALATAQKRASGTPRIDTAGLTGSVLAVNQGWNFVVLSVGDAQGVTVNSPLLVMRGGQRIATLKITSVESRASVADVVPGTTARGESVQPGDRVVFAGTRGETAKPASVPTGLTTPVKLPVAAEAAPARPSA